MATCIILMCGRIGSVYGSNFVGILLNISCETIYYAIAVKLMSEYTANSCDAMPLFIFASIVYLQAVFSFSIRLSAQPI